MPNQMSARSIVQAIWILDVYLTMVWRSETKNIWYIVQKNDNV
jgi:hypothetical protein